MTGPKIRIYGPPFAPFVEKVVRTLGLKKLAYELIEPTGPEDYKRWNPETGLLPVMEIDGERVIDSTRIVDVLDERYPEPPLLAADPKIAATQRQLEEWVGETFFYYWVNWLREQVGTEREDADAAAGTEPDASPRPGPLARLGILRRITESGPTVSARTQTEGLGAEFGRRLDDLVGFLGQRPFFYADRVSRADLAVYSFLCALLRNEIPGGKGQLARRPELTEFMGRVEAETGPPQP